MAKAKSPEETETITTKMKCGIVMPIAGFDGYSADHWKDVKEIIVDAAEKAGFDANIVSYANESTVIHKTIIQNLYDNEIVVVDVSGKNPNVMFELGIRLAFDKPTIVIKDDITNYSFDTSPIDHLGYPGSLHYQSIKGFKDLLSKKIEATYKASQQEGYSSFLKNFGEFTVSHLQKTSVSESEFLIGQLKDILAFANIQTSANVPSDIIHQRLFFDRSNLSKYWNDFLESKALPKNTFITSRLISAFRDWTLYNISGEESTKINKLTDEFLKFMIDYEPY